MAASRSVQTVLVTGANSGLGLATAIELAQRGYRVIGSVRSAEKGQRLTSAARAAGTTIENIVFDVADAVASAAALEEIGPLYGLVNNAGGGGVGAIEDVTDAEARHTMEVMAIAPMRLARLVLPAMRAAGEGRIINISSIYGRTSTPLTGWYQGAKHALEGLSDALRIEVAGAGIKVVLVEPGAFRTAIFDEASDAMAGRPGSHYEAAYRRSSTLTRLSAPFMGNPEQVAKVVATALAARRPRDRYLVGADAQALAAMERAVPLVPRSVIDRVTRLAMGL